MTPRRIFLATLIPVTHLPCADDEQLDAMPLDEKPASEAEPDLESDGEAQS